MKEILRAIFIVILLGFLLYYFLFEKQSRTCSGPTNMDCTSCDAEKFRTPNSETPTFEC